MNFISKEDRPWGSFYVIHDEETYKLKRIEVKSGQRLSYQYHSRRSESWTIVEGNGIVTLEGKDFKVSVGKTILIPKKSKHRIFNNSDKLLIFIEVQTGTYFGEDDIIRISDDYNRVK
tara:strand:- start:18256 stop:18609 length:354 start_codon:yes stop_codon:yes gene_type:complete